MNRRTFNKLSLASVAALPACTSSDFNIQNGIDSHCHIWDPFGHDKTYEGFSFEKLQGMASPSGIKRFIIVVTYAPGNEKHSLAIKEAFKDKISIISLIDPLSKNLEKIMLANREKGIMGYRLNSKFTGENWLKTKSAGRMWKIAADLDISICLLRKPNATIGSIKAMLQKHPNTKVVIDHLGLVNPDNRREVNDFLSLSAHDKCYVKVSRFFADRAQKSGTAKMTKLFEKVYRQFGSERLMWGSNAPVEVSGVNHYKQAVNLVLTAPFLKEIDKQNIFSTTAEKLFF